MCFASLKKFLCQLALMILVLSAKLWADDVWCALHLLGVDSDEKLAAIEKQLPALRQLGVNVLVAEVDYGFKFKSHPELRGSKNPITKGGARRFTKACRRQNILLIPQFQCFGHQSWAKETFPLLTRYPELDITPKAFPNNERIYCREWDPMNPRVYEIVYKLIDELLDAFQADYFHVGMDEVFLIGHELSPSTRGKDPAEVFAKAVNDLHRHIVRKRGRQMLMWGDRLIDGTVFDYGEWESSKNGTAGAVDKIPKDIIICDWHYELRDSYP
ncbi:MAG: family 20 glycosylhydrolase, partial [candidate division KSB1 bacterium]|nr:family 20 glycosylhydrolase [candidate division KSB1 bacterium]